MSGLNQKPTDVERQAEVDAHGAVDNLEIKHEKPDESTLVEFVDCGALVKQEPLDGGCTETCQNVYDSLFVEIKNEARSESPEMEHQRDCHVDTPATITDFSFKEEPQWCRLEPSQTAVSLPADLALTLDTSSAKEHAMTEDSKMDEASSVKHNCFKPRTQQTINNDKDTYNRKINREYSAQGDSVARRLDTHTGEILFSCHHCLYNTEYKNHLVRHMRIHTGEKPHSCKYCDYKCSVASNLKRHMRTHTGEKPHCCKYCDYKCSRLSYLKSHMRTHTGEKPYICKHCDCKYSKSSNLQRHMITHHGEKPHSCKYCDYKCSQVSYLKIHMRTHTGEKPYICKHCDYKASQASTLKSHMRTHTGEKPYICKHCDCKYSRSSNLQRHMRTHTGW